MNVAEGGGGISGSSQPQLITAHGRTSPSNGHSSNESIAAVPLVDTSHLAVIDHRRPEHQYQHHQQDQQDPHTAATARLALDLGIEPVGLTEEPPQSPSQSQSQSQSQAETHDAPATTPAPLTISTHAPPEDDSNAYAYWKLLGRIIPFPPIAAPLFFVRLININSIIYSYHSPLQPFSTPLPPFLLAATRHPNTMSSAEQQHQQRSPSHTYSEMMGVEGGAKRFGSSSSSSSSNNHNNNYSSSTLHTPHASATTNSTDAKTHLVSDVVSRLALAAAALESSAALDSQLGPGASALSRRLDKFKSPSLPKKTAIFAAKGLIHTLERQQVSVCVSE